MSREQWEDGAGLDDNRGLILVFITALQNDNVMRARSVGDGVDIEPRYETIEIAPSKRDGGNSNAIDAVNLNVSGDEGITMTFVETIDDAEDDA